MSLVVDKEQLVDNVMRLRRAERVSPAVDDLAVVRSDLERRIGRTVPRAMAARRLGISQTALDRWISRGDVPVVMTAGGRREVPLDALLDLVDDVDRRKLEDPDDPHPVAAVMRNRDQRAKSLDPESILPRRYRRTLDRHGHRGAELRALAYHRALARRLDEHVVAAARGRLRRWEHEGRIDGHYAREWSRVLSWPLPRIGRLISEDSQAARDLRQSSPFAGALNEHERRRVLESLV